MPRLAAGQFPIKDFSATVLARPDALVGRIEKGAVRRRRSQRRLSHRQAERRDGRRPDDAVARREGNLGRALLRRHPPSGHGSLGSANVSATLRWAEGGIARSNGAARIAIAPGPATPSSAAGSASPSAGRRPARGGRPHRVRRDGVPLPGVVARGDRRPADRGVAPGLRLPPARARPRRVRPDLPELHRGLGATPSPLGLGGNGEVEGHIAKSWGDPEVTARFTAENARYGGVLFGASAPRTCTTAPSCFIRYGSTTAARRSRSRDDALPPRSPPAHARLRPDGQGLPRSRACSGISISITRSRGA